MISRVLCVQNQPENDSTKLFILTSDTARPVAKFLCAAALAQLYLQEHTIFAAPVAGVLFR